MSATEGMQMLEKLGYVCTWKRPQYAMETWTHTESNGKSWVILLDSAFGIGSEYRSDSRSSSRLMTISELEAAMTRFSEITRGGDKA